MTLSPEYTSLSVKQLVGKDMVLAHTVPADCYPLTTLARGAIRAAHPFIHSLAYWSGCGYYDDISGNLSVVEGTSYPFA